MSGNDRYLDRATSIDDLIEENRDLLKESIETQKEIRDLLNNINLDTGSGENTTPVNVDSQEGGELLLWPRTQAPQPQGSAVDVSTLSGTLLPGKNVFDFVNGTVDLAGKREENLSNALKDIDDEEFVRSFQLHADDHIRWSTGSSNFSTYMNQFRTDLIQGQNIKELVIESFNPTAAFLFASTSDSLGMQRTGVERPLERGTWSTANDSPSYTVGDEFRRLFWTTEEDMESSNPTPHHGIHLMNLSGTSLVVSNNGDNPVDISIKMKDHIYHGQSLETHVGETALPGWSESSPETVEANSNEDYNLDMGQSGTGLPVHFIEVDARCGVTGGETDVAAVVMSITE